MAGQRYKTFFLQKLDLLKQERAHVHDVVDEYVNKVVKEAHDWLDTTGGQQLSSQELGHLIESATLFLVEKGTEIAGEHEKHKHGETSETEASRTQPLSVSSENTETGGASLSLNTANDSTVTTTHMKEVLARLDTLEKTVSSIHRRSDDLDTREGEEKLNCLSAKQAEMQETLVQIKSEQSDQRESIESILSQISSMEDNQQMRMTTLTTNNDDVTKNQEAARKSQEIMITDLQKRVDYLSEKLEEMKEKVGEDLDEQMKKLFGKVQDMSSKMVNKSKLEAEKFSEFQNQVVYLQDTVAGIQGEMSVSDSKMGDQMKYVEQMVSAVSGKVRDIDAATGKMSKKVTEMDVITEGLSKKLHKTQGNNDEKMKQLEIKVLEVERQVKRDVSGAGTQYKTAQLQDLSSTAFKASACCILPKLIMPELQKRHVITNYHTVEPNHGAFFDSWTGIYTVPRDGKYHVTFAADNVNALLNLYHQNSSDQKATVVCDNKSSGLHNGVRGGMRVVTLRRGDRLYLEGYYAGNDNLMAPIPSINVTFSVSYIG